jgi:hypothetical protein
MSSCIYLALMCALVALLGVVYWVAHGIVHDDEHGN